VALPPFSLRLSMYFQREAPQEEVTNYEYTSSLFFDVWREIFFHPIQIAIVPTQKLLQLPPPREHRFGQADRREFSTERRGNETTMTIDAAYSNR
jgi:hypothetical protein